MGSLLCFATLFECLYFIIYAVDAILDCRPNCPGSGSHGKIEGLGYFFPGGTGLLRGREARRSSGAAPGRQHGSQSHKLTCLFVHCAISIIKSGKLFDFHDFSSFARLYGFGSRYHLRIQYPPPPWLSGMFWMDALKQVARYSR